MTSIQGRARVFPSIVGPSRAAVIGKARRGLPGVRHDRETSALDASGKVWQLAGKPADRNTAAEADCVKPKENEWRLEMKEAAASNTSSARSLTVLRLE